MKKILFVCLFLSGIAIKVSAQTTPVSSDSTGDKSINVDNPNSVSEQSVRIADTTMVAPSGNSAGQSSSSFKETETIHIYSGSQQGNNVIKTLEVPRPERK